MKQYLLRFATPPEAKVYPNDFREALAKHDLPALFFSRDPETGKSISGKVHSELGVRKHIEKHGVPPAPATEEQRANPFALPGIRIVGSAKWVGILATGERYKPLLDAATVPAIQTIRALLGKATSVELEQRDLVAEALQYPRRYIIRELVMKSGLTKEEGVSERVQERILQGLERQAAAYGLDLPTRGQLDVRVTNVDRPRGLRMVTSTGPTKQFVGLANVEFYACVDLKGYWFIGNLTSRGYGRIIAHHPATHDAEAA